MTRRDLERVVATNDKQRFAIDDTGTRIRAKQGHSIEVDLGLEPVPPPEVLYHGTYPTAARSIARDGIRPMGRRLLPLAGRTCRLRSCGRLAVHDASSGTSAPSRGAKGNPRVETTVSLSRMVMLSYPVSQALHAGPVWPMA